MRDKHPLSGMTVIFTGTPKAKEAVASVQLQGGNPVILPLIKTVEKIVPTDSLRMQTCTSYEWLIFTSANAAHYFGLKMEQEGFTAEDIPVKIAAVGSETAKALENIGFRADFIPATFSADHFVEEFPSVSDENDRCLFLKGDLAKETIKEGLPNEVDEWTVYETVNDEEGIRELADELRKGGRIAVLFASPSAVRVFDQHIAPDTGWAGFTIGAIGHVTEQALQEAGAAVHVKPERYTLLDLVRELGNRKEGIS
ncbi:uroporphyrinogen-III synthase [Bhargavaea ginsengi]|uniref:Uroporphyrinogen-III synthase n=1 Tax=Bhargavaea ginsengi TaxID=426757 RepID=A0A1H6XLJ6_9BACL|nr:uroporphyrinogen-III synthase [Bhargavaea ginsengi]MCM3086583.1 uroporphyrinogen-III synthase [Bhargavaea ginsengi]SEJ25710.1 uroporphyrinogen-III synthase [Bhargavaea ginsengi]